ncbi:threonine synthase [Rhizobiales bacterium GAS113]|nr:threonine synthase [Rhizobiales bacterium GAS113]
MTVPVRNPRLAGFACIRCEARSAFGDHPEGCPVCLGAGFPSSVAPTYAELAPFVGRAAGRGMTRFAGRLPYTCFPSLGEGDTPFLELERLAARLHLDALHIKHESANPTGSHKDRMSAQFVARALDRGVSGVVAASSGNAGASLATYAALAGLACRIVTTPAINPIWRRAIEMAGAELHFEADSLSRWSHVKALVRQGGWMSATNYLDPPVGSEPCGVEGYKTLGYELAEEQAIAAADVVLVPTARGDLLFGIAKGLLEARSSGAIARIPKLIAVEPFARLTRVLAGEDYRRKFEGRSTLSSSTLSSSPLSSINGPTATFQSLLALRQTAGEAVAVNSEQVLDDQRLLAAQGIYLESSAAAALTALRFLLARDGAAIRRAVLIGTSSGYKELY